MSRCMGLGFVPLGTGLVILTAMFVCYAIMVAKGDADPILPSISDGGTVKPGMFIFSQLFNIASALALLTSFIRYKMVCVALENCYTNARKLRRLAAAAVVMSIISSVGLTVLANFPYNEYITVHFFGAAMTFAGAPIYLIMDSVITLKIRQAYNSICAAVVRIALAALSFVSAVTLGVAVIIFRQTVRGDFEAEELLHWPTDRKGKTTILALNFSEWILACVICAYFFTYISEFRRYKLHLKIEPIDKVAASSDTRQHSNRSWIKPIMYFHKSGIYNVSDSQIA